jgi:hypothetical protein
VNARPKRLDTKAHRTPKIGEKSRAALPVEPHLLVPAASFGYIFVDPERERDPMAQERKRQWPRNADRPFRTAGLRPAEILRSILLRDREGALRKGGNRNLGPRSMVVLRVSHTESFTRRFEHLMNPDDRQRRRRA